MALDGILLSKLIPEIQATLPFRIQKIYMTSQNFYYKHMVLQVRNNY